MRKIRKISSHNIKGVNNVLTLSNSTDM